MLSVIIIAKNEAENIRRTLESVKWADEIIVLDSGSMDNTVAIAKEYTPNVYETDWHGYGVQKKRALSHATKEWVLNLDADEVVSPELASQIKKAIQSESIDGFRIPIKMNFFGKNIKYSYSPSRHVRLFRRNGANFCDDIVHEKIILPEDARIEKLSAPIWHYSFRDLSHALYKINRYSSYTAKIRRERQKNASMSKTIFSSIWMFFRAYILQKGFLDGREGFVLAAINAQGTFYRGLKQIYPDKDIKDLPKVSQTGVTKNPKV